MIKKIALTFVCLLPLFGLAKPPNVVLVITDDQGYGDIAAHGNPIIKTPHLDDLHKQSVRLTDVPCGTNLCT